MKCTKAIIAVAGYGTRRLPITKAIEKCMLPVGNRPIIDYVVEDCVKAGIQEIIFVVGEEFEQLKKYYGHNQLLEDYLRSKGKTKELDEVLALNQRATFHYVVQDQHQPYGTNTPVWLSRQLIDKGEKFLVVFGDQFIYRRDGGSEIVDFLDDTEHNQSEAAMLATEVPWEVIDQYATVVTETHDGQETLQKIIEKPKREEAPSNLSNASCFILNDTIFEHVERVAQTEQATERYFIDAVNSYAEAGHRVHVFRARGEFLDCGTLQGWLHANNCVLGENNGV